MMVKGSRDNEEGRGRLVVYMAERARKNTSTRELRFA